ncbi:MAG TPA: LysR family transcriptional regulator [Pyrinomonadaceae bacterium]
MTADLQSLSTDQVAAFVELAKQGSLRRAAEVLHITEQGVRNRLLVLEQRLGVELYRKSQGGHRATSLTEQGQQCLPHAMAFLERARQLSEVFSDSITQSQMHVAASQYLILYVLIDAVREFHGAYPHIHVRLSSRTEQEVEDSLLDEPDLAFGVAASYEPSPKLEYKHLFSMGWVLITPLRHPLLRKSKVRLRDVTDVPLILFERGSAGRKQIMDAFHGQGLSPHIEMETTNTEIIIRMVEAGLGVSIIPMMASRVLMRGRQVGVCHLSDQINPIHSGVLIRRGEQLSAASQSFINFLLSYKS